MAVREVEAEAVIPARHHAGGQAPAHDQRRSAMGTPVLDGARFAGDASEEDLLAQ
jgi:hypothetical protein